MSTTSLLQLLLKISSERWKKERNELLPLMIKSKKHKRSYDADGEEEKKKKKVAKRARKEKIAKKGGGRGGSTRPAPPLPPPERLFLDLNEEPNSMWEEMMKGAGKPTVVFNRKLTNSDVRRDLARCILNRREMLEVLVPALTKKEVKQVYHKKKKLPVVVLVVVEGRCEKKRYKMKMVWWPALKQFALVSGWTEFVDDNHLLEHDLIQLSYFRFCDDRQSHPQLGLLIHCRPTQPQPQPQPQPHEDQDKDPDQDQETTA